MTNSSSRHLAINNNIKKFANALKAQGVNVKDESVRIILSSLRGYMMASMESKKENAILRQQMETLVSDNEKLIKRNRAVVERNKTLEDENRRIKFELEMSRDARLRFSRQKQRAEEAEKLLFLQDDENEERNSLVANLYRLGNLETQVRILWEIAEISQDIVDFSRNGEIIQDKIESLSMTLNGLNTTEVYSLATHNEDKIATMGL